MERTDTDIDRYLAGLPDDVRHDMVAIDAIASDVFADHGKGLLFSARTGLSKPDRAAA